MNTLWILWNISSLDFNRLVAFMVVMVDGLELGGRNAAEVLWSARSNNVVQPRATSSSSSTVSHGLAGRSARPRAAN